MLKVIMTSEVSNFISKFKLIILRQLAGNWKQLKEVIMT